MDIEWARKNRSRYQWWVDIGAAQEWPDNPQMEKLERNYASRRLAAADAAIEADRKVKAPLFTHVSWNKR